MLKIRIVFAEVFICPETMKLLQKSSRETHLEATATRFELAGRFYPAPGRRRFILKGARLRRASGLAGQGSPHQARDPEFQLFIFS